MGKRPIASSAFFRVCVVPAAKRRTSSIDLKHTDLKNYVVKSESALSRVGLAAPLLMAIPGKAGRVLYDVCNRYEMPTRLIGYSPPIRFAGVPACVMRWKRQCQDANVWR